MRRKWRESVMRCMRSRGVGSWIHSFGVWRGKILRRLRTLHSRRQEVNGRLEWGHIFSFYAVPGCLGPYQVLVIDRMVCGPGQLSFMYGQPRSVDGLCER